MATNEGISKEQLTALKAPFHASDHEFLSGMAYLTEFAITNRIENIDPSWQFIVREVKQRKGAGDKTPFSITVIADLQINGVTRSGVGQAVAWASGSGNEANEAEKSATTDALKRASRLFGIGRYLLKLPRNVSDTQSMANWLENQKPVDPDAWNETNMRQFWNEFHGDKGLSSENILEAMGVDKLSQWTQGYEQAGKRMFSYMKNNQKAGA